MTIDMWPIARVRPYERNPRRNQAAVDKVAASIRVFGFRQPIVIDEAGVIIVGHTRWLAARELQLTEVPVHVAVGLTPDQARAYRLADNRLHEESEWDDALLSAELTALDASGFDLTLTGFDDAELERLVAAFSGFLEGVDEDAVPDPPVEPVAQLGDVYRLGRHRLMCGSATDANDVSTLIRGERIDMVYTDPPYGISIVGPDGKIGSASRTYAPIIGDDSTETAIAAYHTCCGLKPRVMVFWGGNYYAHALPPSSCWLVWDKQNAGTGFADAELAWTNQPTAVRLFQHQWNGVARGSESSQPRLHPTQKPVALAEWCFERYGQPTDVVLDLFGGSGSTLIACEKMGRRALLMEIAPAYCDVIVRRWEAATGRSAERVARDITAGAAEDQWVSPLVTTGERVA